MAAKTADEIEAFVSGTVITELYAGDDIEYPYYYLGESLLGWGEYMDTSNFDPFKILGFTVQVVRVESENYGDLDSSDVLDITNNSGSLTAALEAFKALGPNITIEKI